MLQRHGGVTATRILWCALVCALLGTIHQRPVWADGSDNTIELNGRVITMTADVPAGAAATDQHVYVQTKSVLDSADRARFLALGVEVRQYVMNNTYVMYCKAGSIGALLADPVVSGCADIPREHKVSQTTAAVADREAGAADGPPTAPLGEAYFRVLSHLGVDVAALQSQLATDLGLTAEIVDFGQGHALELRCSAAAAMQIAQLDDVATVALANGTRSTFNSNAQAYTRSDIAQLPPLSLDGTGVTVLVRDEGTPQHADYDARVTILEAEAVSDHHSHVTGTVAGDGTGNAAAEGMAPAADIVTTAFEGSPPFNDTPEIRDPWISDGAQLSNHSYGFSAGWEGGGLLYWDTGGDMEFGRYDVGAKEWDDLVTGFDLIIVSSAGNQRSDVNGSGLPHFHASDGFVATFTDSHPDDGPYNSINGNQIAKNIITVGAVDHTNEMSSFSSWGGGGDGRLKPDVVSDGVNLLSTLPGDTYGIFSGTSMSSPATAGSMALLIEKYKADNAGANPSAALAKAALIHGARDLTPAHGPDYDVGPDYASGYGAVDIVNSIGVLEPTIMQTGVFETTVGNGATNNHVIPVMVRACEPLKVTLVWMDPSGAVGAASPIVNNLDLKVTGPGGAELFPYVLNPANPSAAPTKGVNAVDTVEQVFSFSPPGDGTYTIEVTGTSVPSGPQAYAVTWSTLSSSIPATSVRVSTSSPSPQVAGTSVTITGDACGGLPPYDYKFWLNGPANGFTWTQLQDFGSGDSFVWNTTGADVGTSTIRIWAKSTISTNVRDVIVDLSFTITGIPGPTSVDLVSNDTSDNPLPGPQAAGTVIRLQAQNEVPPEPGPNDYLYQFWQIGPGTGGAWTIVQPYSTQDFFDWPTSASNVGTTTTRVWVKHAGSGNARDAMGELLYTIVAGAGPVVSLAPDVPSPQVAGATVTFTATPVSGFVNPVQYQFWINGPGTGGAWTLAQAFSTTSTFAWNTLSHAGGDTLIRVWAKSAGSLNVRDAIADVTFTVTSVNNPAIAVSLSSSQPSPVTMAQSFTLVAAASGGTGVYEYQFWGHSASSDWVLLQAYSPAASATITPPGVGTNRYRVWARSQGSGNARDVIADLVLHANPVPPTSMTFDVLQGRNVDATQRTLSIPDSRLAGIVLAPRMNLVSTAAPAGGSYEFNIQGPPFGGLPTGYGTGNTNLFIKQSDLLSSILEETGTFALIGPKLGITDPSLITSQVRSVGSINPFDLQQARSVGIPLPSDGSSARVLSHNLPGVVAWSSINTTDGQLHRGDFLMLNASYDASSPPCTGCDWEVRFLVRSPTTGVSYDEITGWNSLPEDPTFGFVIFNTAPYITFMDVKVEVRVMLTGLTIPGEPMSGVWRVPLRAPRPPG